MGCSASVEIFDKTVYPYPDGDEKKAVIITVHDPLTLKGDALSKSNAKWSREQVLREKHKKRFNEAKEMSDCIMDEKERLSLSTRSRATSRNTSRTGSPKHDRVLSSGLSVRPYENGKRYDTPPGETGPPSSPPLSGVHEVSEDNSSAVIKEAVIDKTSCNNNDSEPRVEQTQAADSSVTLLPVSAPVTLNPVSAPVTLNPVSAPVTLNPVSAPVGDVDCDNEVLAESALVTGLIHQTPVTVV